MLSDLEKKAVDAVDCHNLMDSVNTIAMYERLSGSDDEYKAFEFIEERMRSYGFKTLLFKHDAYISLPVSASLKVISPEPIDMFCITHSCGASTPACGVNAEAVWIGAPRKLSGDADVRGKFVVIEGNAGPDPTVWANERGVLGQIHVSADEHIHDMTVQNVWGSPDDKNVSTLPRTYVVSIARADGDKLKALLDKGPVSVHVETKVDTKWTKIPLLECDLDGIDGAGDFLLLSGHVDSWYHGAMDNGSANATMMEVARVLASLKNRLRRGLKVCFWSGHSHGRYAGSAWYCDNRSQELYEHCVMHLNTDSTGGIGATNLRRASIMAETRGIGKWAIQEVMGIPFEGSRIARNGDQSFWGLGIPSMFVSVSSQPEGGLGWWWHNPADLPDKLDPDYVTRDTKIYTLVAARILGAVALPFDYGATLDEWLGTLGSIQEKVGDKFDLSTVISQAEELKTLLGLLRRDNVSIDAARAINRCVMKVGRALVSVGFTRAGRFAQDPALGVPTLPDVSDAIKLSSLADDGDEARFLKVRLFRGRNRISAALSEAASAVREAVELLN